MSVIMIALIAWSGPSQLISTAGPIVFVLPAAGRLAGPGGLAKIAGDVVSRLEATDRAALIDELIAYVRSMNTTPEAKAKALQDTSDLLAAEANRLAQQREAVHLLLQELQVRHRGVEVGDLREGKVGGVERVDPWNTAPTL